MHRRQNSSERPRESAPYPRRGAHQALCVCLLALLPALITACQTPPTGLEPPENAHRASTPFTPDVTQANIHLLSGRYPNLFAIESRAYWLDEFDHRDALPSPLAEASGAPLEANVLPDFGPNYVLIACSLVSRFSDPSIGYDAVRLRGVQAQLLLPDGHSIAPAHQRSDSVASPPLEDLPHAFHRIHYLAFPKDALHQPGNSSAPGGAARLMLEGYDTTFYFAWEMSSHEDK